MDVDRGNGGDGGEAVALLVDEDDLAGLEGDEKALDRVSVVRADDATASLPQELESERKSEESRAADYGDEKTVEPPPAPTQLYPQASTTSSEQTRVSSPSSPSESKHNSADDGGEEFAARSDEWASTRRSGKRTQSAPRAASGRSPAALAGAKEAKTEASASNQPRVDQQSAKKDTPLLLEVDGGDNGRQDLRRLGDQEELKDDAGIDFGLEDEESPVSHGMSEYPMPPLHVKEVESSDAQHASVEAAVVETQAAYPSAVDESLAATTQSTGSIPPSVPTVDATPERPGQPRAIGSAHLAPSTIADEQEWAPCVSDSGHTYYYNRFTQECRWQRPQSPEQRQRALDAVVSPDRVKLLERLLVEGLDPNTTSTDGPTLLHLATQSGNVRAVELLLSYGAAVESTSTITPLHTACRYGQDRIATLLLESGASPERTDADGNSALHLVISSPNSEILGEILAVAGDRLVNQQNAEGETALHIAAKLDNAEAVQTLLDHGADTGIEDVQGQSPLIVAILENSVGCAQLLQSVQASESDAQETTIPPASDDMESDVDKLLASIVPVPESCDHEVLEALRSFADETQRAISTLEDQLQEKKRNEKNYHAQIQSLSSSLQAANTELEKEKHLRLQTEAAAALKASELEVLRASLVATMTRCSMLESVARDAHAKLRSERKERMRSEDAVHDRLQHLLDENASLLQTIYGFQASSVPAQSTSETRLFVDRSRQRSRQPEVAKKPTTPARYAQYPDAPPSAFSDHDQSPYATSDQNYHEQHGQHRLQPPRHVTFADTSATTHRNKREEVRAGSETAYNSSEADGSAHNPDRTPPSRVGAVWNRFYENLGQVSARDLAAGNPSSQASGRPPASIFDAIRRSDLQQLQTLLLAGTPPNQRDPTEKGTPLHLACELGDLDAVVLLCDFAAELEARDEEANTPLLTACAQGNFECTKFLLQSAASLRAVNAEGQTALHLAAWDGSAECVAILIEYGVDSSATNSFGLSALGNLKTRSPLRHKLEDLPSDHPIRATIRILEEHEAQQEQQETRVEGKRRLADVAPMTSPPPPPRATWKEWLFGVKAPTDESIATSRLDEVASDDDREDDDQELSSSSDAEPDASAFQRVTYPPLTPPPEVVEAISRAHIR